MQREHTTACRADQRTCLSVLLRVARSATCTTSCTSSDKGGTDPLPYANMGSVFDPGSRMEPFGWGDPFGHRFNPDPDLAPLK